MSGNMHPAMIARLVSFYLIRNRIYVVFKVKNRSNFCEILQLLILETSFIRNSTFMQQNIIESRFIYKNGQYIEF